MAIRYNTNIVRNGLVLHLDAANRKSYPGSGTIWTDLSGNANNGTLTNGPTFNGANGGSFVFDGIDDYINNSSVSLFNLGSKLTICSFVKFNNVNILENPIFSTLDVTTGNTYTEGYGFFHSNSSSYGLNSKSLRFQFGQNNWAWNFYGSNGITITDNNWHFVAISASLLNTNSPVIIFYIDNKSINATFWNASNKSAIRYSSNINSGRIGSIYYATRPNYSGPHYGNLNLSNLQIYNRDLTPQEVSQNFEALRDRYGI